MMAPSHSLPAERRIVRLHRLSNLLRCGAVLATAALGVFALRARPPLALVWNSSESSARGLYRLGSAEAVRRGDMVVAWLPPKQRMLAASRRYLPANVPLVKRVAAVHGDRVCAAGDTIFVNGMTVSRRLPRDVSGRLLPRWSGCSRLAGGELLLLSSRAGSFDARYFGPVPARLVIGRARLIWPG